MNVWRVIAATVVIFLTGVITGALVANQVHLRQSQVSTAHHPAGSPTLPNALWPRTATNVPPSNASAWKRLTTDFMASFGKDLSLTAEQAERVEAIILSGQMRTKEISDELQPMIREEMKHTRERIHAELNPEQREKFDALYRGKPQTKAGDSPKPANKSKKSEKKASGERPDQPPAAADNEAVTSAN